MAEKMTITIPIDPVVLRETANMCNRLASSLTGVPVVSIGGIKLEGTTEPTRTSATTPELPAGAKTYVEHASTVPLAAAPPVAAAAPPAAAAAPPAAAAAPPVAAAAAELANGLPWDARIHVASKTKYQTAPFGWKLKKQLDPEFVKAVEAELRAGGGAPTPAGMTYAELLAQITAQGVPNEEVLDVLAEFRISSIGLLAAKPALIPAFAERLFAGE